MVKNYVRNLDKVMHGFARPLFHALRVKKKGKQKILTQQWKSKVANENLFGK